MTPDEYFQRELTDCPFVCPVCVRHGVESCAEHKPRTAEELAWNERGQLRPTQAERNG